jgi:hypothetical protein
MEWLEVDRLHVHRDSERIHLGKAKQSDQESRFCKDKKVDAEALSSILELGPIPSPSTFGAPNYILTCPQLVFLVSRIVTLDE